MTILDKEKKIEISNILNEKERHISSYNSMFKSLGMKTETIWQEEKELIILKGKNEFQEVILKFDLTTGILN